MRIGSDRIGSPQRRVDNSGSRWTAAEICMNEADRAGRILVIRGGAIGDFILTIPALAALKQAFPNVRVEVVTYPRVAGLATEFGHADAAHSIESRAMAGF